MIISDKIKLIRYEHEISRSKLAEGLDISVRTLEAIENRGSDLRTSVTQKLCKFFPEYTLWLMIDEINLESGQISPPIKAIIKTDYYLTNSDEKFNFELFMKRKYFVQYMKKVMKKYCKNNYDCELNEVRYPSDVYHKLNIKKWV